MLTPPGCLYVGLRFGALIGQGIAGLAAYPFVVWLARHARAWDPKHDVVYAGVAAAIILSALWFNFDAVAELAAQ
ncbi:MAG: hypothetical protein JJ869_22980 [Marivita sp.]|uniref:hypothetical protein n=1 Tax=Marivita sp. TaxID=2003365 RepID=UPI001B0790CA|nr:hypothetical protein [Marivita sp.]MBO6886415.1 hypothetical protein [Marivita sp.]